MRDQRAEVFLGLSPDERFTSEAAASRDFRILVVDDFAGRGDAAPLASDLPRKVDRDDLDAHVARIAPRLWISVAGELVDLAFASMDDFHPDRLAVRLAALRSSSTPRRASESREPSTTSAAASSLASPASPASDAPPSSAVPRMVSGGSLLDDMLDDAGAPAAAGVTPAAGRAPSAARSRSDELSAFIDHAVAPHLVRSDSAAEARAEATQRETVDLLRLVLHHPNVQALEATWRSLELLVRRLDTDGDLHLFLLDAPLAQVATAVEHVAQRRDAADPERWALVVALHAFADGAAGADAFARLAMAAKAVDAPCVAAAPLSFAGVDTVARLHDDEHTPAAVPDVYSLIRQSQDGHFLGLTFPRVMLRAPYGRENPCDTIDFDELDDPERHDHYLWGSGAMLVALLVGEAFAERGWAIGPRLPLDVGGLPYFTFRRGPETVAKSCAEMIMSERIARGLLARGLMPVAWIKDTDRVRVVEIRSVSEPSAPLAGAWASASPRAVS